MLPEDKLKLLNELDIKNNSAENTHKAGVYGLLSPHNILYIGRAKKFRVRWSGHRGSMKSKFRPNSNRHFVNSLKKYGFENFKKIIIEFVDDPKTRSEREEYWIAYFQVRNPEYGYNINPGGDNPVTDERVRESLREYWKTHKHPTLGMKHTDEIKKIISQTSIDRFQNPENHPTFNKPRPLELRQQISQTQIEKYAKFGHHSKGVLWTKQAKLNRKNAIEKRVVQLDPITSEIIKVWDNASTARKALIGPDRKDNTINKVLNPKMANKIAHGFRWTYLDDAPIDYQI